MLVLSRRVGERIVIGDNITVIVRRVARDRVSLAIDAPPHVRIMRTELQPVLDDLQLGSASGACLGRPENEAAGASLCGAGPAKPR